MRPLVTLIEQNPAWQQPITKETVFNCFKQLLLHVKWMDCFLVQGGEHIYLVQISDCHDLESQREKKYCRGV